MSSAIEDYAIISDCHTAALIGIDGGIDWLCLPRYDSPSVFGALLGTEEHGRWLLAPASSCDGHAEHSSGSAPGPRATRHYLDDTFLLVTRWTTPTGVVEVTDFMPHGDRRADIVRRVVGIEGEVEMKQELRMRFDYARAVPWVRQAGTADAPALVAVAGPSALVLRGVELVADDHAHSATFSIAAGETVDLTMTWYPSHRDAPPAPDVDDALATTVDFWRAWAEPIVHTGPYHTEVVRSLLVLRALTHEDTGGIVAAATTSLPEQFGGARNWDYRYVWLRDASLTLDVLLSHGFTDEAAHWRTWLLRAIAGDPADVQIMYGLAGERDLPERELDALPGYRGATPVRIGNGAALQYQADVIGEVMVALHEARVAGVDENEFSWPLQRALLGFVEDNWQRPDNGIWEIRGQLQHFTHSRAMIWAALDRGVRAVRDHGLDGPADRWAELRDEVRDEIHAKGLSSDGTHFVQYYGTDEVDASLLQLPQIGFCDYGDERMLATVAALEHDLLDGGLLHRYRTESAVDGLGGTEHPFLACSFWLVEQYAETGRLTDARRLMDRLVGFCNDVGLLSEEYDVERDRQAGNTPQALSHLALVRAADAIGKAQRHG